MRNTYFSVLTTWLSLCDRPTTVEPRRSYRRSTQGDPRRAWWNGSRSASRAGTLNGSAAVLLTAVWEGFVEDAAAQALDRLVEAVSSAKQAAEAAL